MMTFLQTIISLIASHIYIVSFLAGVFGGEETAILFLTLLIHSKSLIFVFFILFQIGNLVMDTIIFFLSKTKVFDFVVKREFASKSYKQFVYIMNRYAHKNPFVTMLITKFIYGTRIITIIYMAREKLNFRRFISYNVITTFLWMSVLTALGLIVGASVSALVSTVKRVELGIILFFAVIIAIYVINSRIKTWLLKKQKK
jgi:membrane protein DedA with SNARE-associated domain